MSVRLRSAGTAIDRPVLAAALLAVVVTAVGALWLAQAALPLQVDVAGADGGRLGLGLAGPGATTTFREIADPGGTWTFVVSYGGRELLRQTVSAKDLAGRDWTFQIPDDVTMKLERQGYR